MVAHPTTRSGASVRSFSEQRSNATVSTVKALLKLRVLTFGLLQDGDVGVGILPEREEIRVSGERPYTGGIGIRALRGPRLQRIGTSHTQMRQRSRPAVPHDPAVVENLLKLGRGSITLSGCQVCLSTYIYVVEAGDIGDELN